MKCFIGLTLLSSALLGTAKYTKEDYRSGLVHNQIMERKLVSEHSFDRTDQADSYRLHGQDKKKRANTTRTDIQR